MYRCRKTDHIADIQISNDSVQPLLLHDLFLLADEEQALLIRHRLHGCSLAETARREGMSVKRVRHRLKALYRAYFAQEKTKQKEL